MNNDPMNDLEQLRRDWQQGASPPPEVTLSALRRRLSRRWFLVGFELLAFIACTVVLIWSVTRIDGWMDWLYWGFFAAVFVFAGAGTVKLRRRSLWRDSDSTGALLDHARRDARVREIGGRFSLCLVSVMWLFVMVYTLAVGLDSSEPLGAFLFQRWKELAFLTAWFAMAMLLGAWMREKGRRQLLELDQLIRDLSD